MTWKVSYALLLLIIPSLGLFIYKKIAEPISSYIVNGNIRIVEDEYDYICSENERLINEIRKLQKIKEKKGDMK
ncbi:hypothetical protein [Sporanaerobacter acetigenes]|uniref:Uncharacterized protein n=1 Tax=Sporanaerobacter acetigenes DSM 13106 TaxID=1123281 RepID=A0A1M5U969_9FIRM|nr:hypothetical protein [Sporanaerobacter acetigenes]SHH59499.1 hypothetical protein SAMN02745180_00565 [Sporanaerobacter acetigenes DSM 13106]